MTSAVVCEDCGLVMDQWEAVLMDLSDENGATWLCHPCSEQRERDREDKEIFGEE